jgi:hypothetical protein
MVTPKYVPRSGLFPFTFNKVLQTTSYLKESKSVKKLVKRVRAVTKLDRWKNLIIKIER